MKGRGFITQCSGGPWGFATPDEACPETTRLEKPKQWRCPACVSKHGELKE